MIMEMKANKNLVNDVDLVAQSGRIILIGGRGK